MGNTFNLFYAIITAGITLLGGITLFIIQRIIDRVFMSPIQKQKEAVEEIAIYLIHYSKLYSNPETSLMDSYGNPKQRHIDAMNKTRELAALLKVRTDNIPCYGFWKNIGYVLPKEKIDIAWRELIGLSNSFTGNDSSGIKNTDIANKVRGLLKIPKAD